MFSRHILYAMRYSNFHLHGWLCALFGAYKFFKVMHTIQSTISQILKPETTHNPYSHLYRYFPIHACSEDAESNRLRLFKAGIRNALKHYYYCLQNWISYHIDTEVSIVAVPSSDHTRINSITKVARAIAKNNRMVSDATMAISKKYTTASFCRTNNRNTDDMIRSLRIDKTLIAGKHILLVDDISTTGKTFEILEQLLFDNGAASVMCVSLGKTILMKNLR
jgi:hypothetical protein